MEVLEPNLPVGEIEEVTCLGESLRHDRVDLVSSLADESARLHPDLLVLAEERGPEPVPCVAEAELARLAVAGGREREEGDLVQGIPGRIPTVGKWAQPATAVQPVLPT